MLLSTSLCSIVVVGYIGYDSGKAARSRSIFDHLTSVRASKGDQIRSLRRSGGISRRSARTR
jgi:hypothetical protein